MEKGTDSNCVSVDEPSAAAEIANMQAIFGASNLPSAENLWTGLVATTLIALVLVTLATFQSESSLRIMYAIVGIIVLIPTLYFGWSLWMRSKYIKKLKDIVEIVEGNERLLDLSSSVNVTPSRSNESDQIIDAVYFELSRLGCKTGPIK